MKLGLKENPPAPWGIAPARFRETVEDRSSQAGRGEGMSRRRSRQREKIAAEDLSHEMLGESEDILVRGRFASRSRAHPPFRLARTRVRLAIPEYREYSL
jgi:hypothetical protein